MKTFKQYILESEIFPNTKVNMGKRPLTVFRGISPEKKDRHPSSKLGIFFTSNLQTAKAYAEEHGNVLRAIINITNPYKMTYNEIQSITTDVDAISLKNRLINQGHDGIFLLPIDVENSYPNEVSEYIVFDSTNIKEL